MAIAASVSVTCWRFTDLRGAGDLRPYLLLQALSLVLIPLWQWIYDAARVDRLLFAAAIFLCVAAKVT